MSGHSIWQRRLDGSLPVDGAMVQYTSGYLLALEDILKDIDDSSCLADLTKKVQASHNSATRTLEYLQEKESSQEQLSQPQGEAPGLPGPPGPAPE